MSGLSQDGRSFKFENGDTVNFMRDPNQPGVTIEALMACAASAAAFDMACRQEQDSASLSMAIANLWCGINWLQYRMDGGGGTRGRYTSDVGGLVGGKYEFCNGESIDYTTIGAYRIAEAAHARLQFCEDWLQKNEPENAGGPNCAALGHLQAAMSYLQVVADILPPAQ